MQNRFNRLTFLNPLDRDSPETEPVDLNACFSQYNSFHTFPFLQMITASY
jgi:hypothetical protein